MKKVGVAVLLVLVGVAGGLYLTKIAPLATVVTDHELRIRSQEDHVGRLESRTTTAEQRLDEHEKRIESLEKDRKLQADELAALRAALERAHADVSAGQKRMAEIETRLQQDDQDQKTLREELAKLRTEVQVRDAEREKLQRDLLRRVEVLERLNDNKAQR